MDGLFPMKLACSVSILELPDGLLPMGYSQFLYCVVWSWLCMLPLFHFLHVLCMYVQYHYNSETGLYCYYDAIQQAYISVDQDG